MNPPRSLRPEDSGVFSAARPWSGLQQAARRAHCAWLEVKLDGVRTKAEFLAACARALKFPAHFGANWDALADALGDLGWIDAQGSVIVLEGVEGFARHAADEWATALEILRNAAGEWRGHNRTFIVLLDGAPRDAGIAPFSVQRA